MAALDSPHSPLTTWARLNLILGMALALGQTADTTWDCGDLAPTPRMQYTGRSFSELTVTRLLPKALRPKTGGVAPQGFFPSAGNRKAEYSDPLSRGRFMS